MWENWIWIWPDSTKTPCKQFSGEVFHICTWSTACWFTHHTMSVNSLGCLMLSRYSVSFCKRTHANSGGRHRQSCHRSMTAWRALPGSLCRWHKAALLSDAYWNRCTPVFPPELPPRSLWWSRAPALWCGPLSERVMFAWQAQGVWYQVAAAREPVL